MSVETWVQWEEAWNLYIVVPTSLLTDVYHGVPILIFLKSISYIPPASIGHLWWLSKCSYPACSCLHVFSHRSGWRLHIVGWCMSWQAFLCSSFHVLVATAPNLTPLGLYFLNLEMLYSPKSIAAVLERVGCKIHLCSVLMLSILCLSDGAIVSLSLERFEAPSYS